jgi:hypothetical protein
MKIFRRVTSLVTLLSVVCLVGSAGAQIWKPYTFQGTEHFKYDLKSVVDSVTLAGSFTLDIAKAGEDKFKVSFNSVLGETESSSSTTASLDDLAGKIIMSLMMSGNEAAGVLGATLFTPMLGMMFMGTEDLEVGSGWSRTDGGRKMSFKIEAKETIAGQEGYRCVYRQGDDLKYLQVISPNVGLPLKTEVTDEKGHHYTALLVEFKK